MSRTWTKMNLEHVSRERYGDVGKALIRSPNYLLLFIRTLKPGETNYSRTGIYAIFENGIQIGRRLYYGNAPPSPPTHWANQTIALHRKRQS